jgi:RNA polymerase sigma-19 factor, ECF subfamily
MPSSTALPLRQPLLRAAIAHADELTRFLSSQVADVSEAQDLMQEVYLAVLKLNLPEAIRSPRAYLFTIAANLAHRHRLRRAAAPAHVQWDEALPECIHIAHPGFETNAPESEALLAERLEHLGRRLSDLPPKVQAAILWHHRDGYTCEEIGERLSVVRNRVKKYLGKGLAHCRGEPALGAA